MRPRLARRGRAPLEGSDRELTSGRLTRFAGSDSAERGPGAERAAAGARALAGLAIHRRTARDAGLERLSDRAYGALATALEHQRLLPLLGGRALELAERPPREFVERVRDTTDWARRLSELQSLALEPLLAVLGSSGIPALVLKGIPLAERLHGDGALRSSGDFDLLVGRAHLDEAVERLAGVGYRPQVEWRDRRGLPTLHRILSSPGLPAVELHWRLHWYEEAFGEDMLARSSPDPRWGRRPDPLDEGLALLLFHARDGLEGLRVPADIAAWWDGTGAGIDAEAFRARIAAYPALERSFAAAWASLESLIGLPERPWAARPSIRARLAARLADPFLAAGGEQLAAERSLVDGLLTPRTGLWRFVRRSLMPPAGVLRARAAQRGVRLGRRRLRAAQLAVPLQVLPRFGLAILRRRRLAIPSRQDPRA